MNINKFANLIIVLFLVASTNICKSQECDTLYSLPQKNDLEFIDVPTLTINSGSLENIISSNLDNAIACDKYLNCGISFQIGIYYAPNQDSLLYICTSSNPILDDLSMCKGVFNYKGYKIFVLNNTIKDQFFRVLKKTERHFYIPGGIKMSKYIIPDEFFESIWFYRQENDSLILISSNECDQN